MGIVPPAALYPLEPEAPRLQNMDLKIKILHPGLSDYFIPLRITSVFVGSVLSLVFSETYIVKSVYTQPPWDQLLCSE